MINRTLILQQTLSQIFAHPDNVDFLSPLNITVYLPNGELRNMENIVNDLSDLYSKELNNE